MKIWGIKDTRSIMDIVHAVSRERYDGNICFKRLPELTGHTKRSPIVFTLTVCRSAGPGGRRSPSGRKIAAACWHAHRDVMDAIFAVKPDARIKTTLADYEDRDNFERTFELTGNVNCGNMFEPCYIRDACECGED